MAWGNDSAEVALETLQRANELVVGISPEAIENKLPFLRKIPEWVPNFLQSWFLAMCHYPEWQARGQAEVDAICGERMPTAGDIQQLPIVRAMMRETFRWRSPVPFGKSIIEYHNIAPLLTVKGVPHYLEEDDVYEGYHIPKGSQVFALEW